MITVTIDIEVPPHWVKELTQYNDAFAWNTCGYWMYGMEHDAELGWLCYEHDEKWTVRQVEARYREGYEDIVAAWRGGAPLPPGWYRLDTNAAIEAYVWAVKRYGTNTTIDAPRKDTVIQLALLGEVRYG